MESRQKLDFKLTVVEYAKQHRNKLASRHFGEIPTDCKV